MNRIATVLLTTALFSCAGALSCATPNEVRKPVAQTPPSVVAQPYEEWPNPFTTPKTLEAARERRQALEQRPPDRRFLLAFDDIATLMGRKSAAHAEARLSEGRWVISYRDQVVGDVSPFADYDELSACLVRWATAVVGESKHQVPAPSEVVLLDEAVTMEATAVNEAWGKGDRSPEMIARSAHLLTSVAFEANDKVGVADSLFGRAWAVSALAQAQGVRSSSDEALLASALGYTRVANELAKTADDEAVRAFVTGDWKRFDALVPLRPRSAGVRYLQLRALVAAGRREEQEKVAAGVDDTTPGSTLGALARSDVFELMSTYPFGSAVSELKALQSRVAWFGAWAKLKERLSARESRELLSALETALKKLPVRQRVPFDTDVERSAIRARIYSGFSEALEFHLRRRGIVEEGDALVSRFGPADGISGEFFDWMTTRVQVMKGMDWALMEPALSGHWGDLGASTVADITLMDAFEAVPGTAKIVDSVRYFMRRADSRPSHRKLLLDTIDRNLLDPGLSARMTSRWAAVSGDSRSQAWLRQVEGDWAGLEQIANDTALTLQTRFAAVQKLLSSKRLSVDEVTLRLGTLSKATGGETVFREYEAFLNRHDRHAEQIELLSAWVKAHPDDDSIVAADIRSDLARAYRMTGRNEEAWNAVMPAMETWFQSALVEGALATLALGKKKEAVEWAHRILDRYDGASGYLSFAGILWRAEMPVEVAQKLKGKLGLYVWVGSAPGWFIRAFEAGPIRNAEAAIDALVANETPKNLIALAKGLAREGRLDYAVILATKIRERNIDLDVETYLILQRAKGAAEADAWFWQQQAPEEFVRFAYPAYSRGADSLLFSLPTAPAVPPEEMDTLWMLRAASLARRRIKTGPQFDEVRKHFETEVSVTPKNDIDVVPSRFLMGVEARARLVALATTPERTSHAGFYLALAEDRDGHVEEAAESYLDMLDLHQDQIALSWARQRLREWGESGKSLKRLAAEGP